MARRPLTRKSATHVTLGQTEFLAFAGTDYLGLACEPRVIEAQIEGLRDFGASAAASRLTSGTFEAHESLEEALAEFLGLESALVLSSGALANMALLESMRGEVQRLLIDADAHASLRHAAHFHGAPLHDYGPGDPTRLLALCDRFRDVPHAILTDGVFPGHGRMAPVPHLLRYLHAPSWMVLDDSHGIGVMHTSGRGTLHAFGTATDRTLVTFSLGKGLGGAGGAIAGPASAIEAVRRRSEIFAASSALGPANAKSSLSALSILQSEPKRVQRLHRNIKTLHRIAQTFGNPPVGTFLPVWNIHFQGDAEARQASSTLLRHGIYIPSSRYLSAQTGTNLRLSVCSEHSLEDLDRLRLGLTEALDA